MVEIEIMPERLLNDETAIKFLNRVRKISGIIQIMIHGPRYEKRNIYLGKNLVPLMIKIGRFWIEIEDENIVNDIRIICEDLFPFGYRIQPKRFLKRFTGIGDSVSGSPVFKVNLINENEDLEEKCFELDTDFYINDD